MGLYFLDGFYSVNTKMLLRKGYQIMKNLAKLIFISAVSIGVVHCTSTTESHKIAANAEDTDAESDNKLRLHTIYFDFDKYNIRADQQDSATAMAHSIASYAKAHPDLKVQVQGNTDDRGSVEYNMALGTRRAESLKEYLVQSGVNPKTLDTVSFGKERPAVVGNSETAWSQNRRDEVVVVE